MKQQELLRVPTAMRRQRALQHLSALGKQLGEVLPDRGGSCLKAQKPSSSRAASPMSMFNVSEFMIIQISITDLPGLSMYLTRELCAFNYSCLYLLSVLSALPLKDIMTSLYVTRVPLASHLAFKCFLITLSFSLSLCLVSI